MTMNCRSPLMGINRIFAVKRHSLVSHAKVFLKTAELGA